MCVYLQHTTFASIAPLVAAHKFVGREHLEEHLPEVVAGQEHVPDPLVAAAGNDQSHVIHDGLQIDLGLAVAPDVNEPAVARPDVVQSTVARHLYVVVRILKVLSTVRATSTIK